MKEETIEKFIYGNGDNEIYIYAIENYKEGYYSFYLRKKGGFQMNFMECIKIGEYSLKEIVCIHVMDWIEDNENYERINDSIYTLIQDAVDRIEEIDLEELDI